MPTIKVKRKVYCDYCGNEAEFVDSSTYYKDGKSYGMIYICRPCDAIVGVHRGSNRPLGRLANSDLRYWKRQAHKAFDQIWKSGKMERNAAYKWLAEQLGIPRTQCHIGMFGVDRCKQVVRVITGVYDEWV